MGSGRNVVSRALVVLAFFHLGLVAGECMDGWVKFGESCYLFPNVYADWHEAEFECMVVMKGYLAEIETQEENTFLRNEAKTFHASDPSSNNYGYWIGGSDMEVEGKWIWMNSRLRISFSDWYPGEPSNSHSHEDCLRLYGALDFHWNDAPCSSKSYFICEKPISGEPGGILG